jgi:hypothetical protein
MLSSYKQVNTRHASTNGWKHIMVTPLGCHIVLLFRGVHVWVYATSNFWKNFTIVLHITLKYNLGKILKNNYFISFYKVGDWSIFVKTNVMYMFIQQHKYTLKTI